MCVPPAGSLPVRTRCLPVRDAFTHPYRKLIILQQRRKLDGRPKVPVQQELNREHRAVIRCLPRLQLLALMDRKTTYQTQQLLSAYCACSITPTVVTVWDRTSSSALDK
jgi:hypothetical protein